MIIPSVSDHAVLRYMERKYGFDVAAIRAEILTPERREAIRCGAKSITVEGMRFVVRDGTITTALKGKRI